MVPSSGLLASSPTTYTDAHIHTHTHKKINTQVFFKKIKIKKKVAKIIQPSSHFKLGGRGQVSLALIKSQLIQHLGTLGEKRSSSCFVDLFFLAHTAH